MQPTWFLVALQGRQQTKIHITIRGTVAVTKYPQPSRKHCGKAGECSLSSVKSYLLTLDVALLVRVFPLPQQHKRRHPPKADAFEILETKFASEYCERLT